MSESSPSYADQLAARIAAALAADELQQNYFVPTKGGGSIFNPTALAGDVDHVLQLRVTSDHLLRWYDDGVYRDNGNEAAAFVARCLLGKTVNTHRVNEAIAVLRAREAMRLLSVDPDDDTHIVRLRNGILDLRTWEIAPYTPASATTIQLPWQLRDASCPKIEAVLLQIFEGDEEMVDLFYEVAGYLALSRNFLRKAILLYGTGRNGKSILLHLLKSMLGAENVAAVPLQRLGGDDRFAPSQLVGKLANICGDVGPNSARDMSLFKQITGGDPIYAERKGMDGFNFLCGAVPVFSANEFPRSPDTGSAYLNRWLAIECTAEFIDDDKEAELRALGTDHDEMEGFLLQAMLGAKRLVERGTFAVPDKVRQTTKSYADSIDNVRSWLNDECEFGEAYELHRGSAFVLYKSYCSENNYRPLGRNKFFGHMRTVPGVGEGRAGGRRDGEHVFTGVRQPPLDEPGATRLPDWLAAVESE